MASKKKLLQAAAGSAGGGGSLDVDEVFSTYLYDGTGSALTINNGLDLSGEGGLVWTKRRDHAGNGHMLVDTARGGSSFLKSNTTDAANTSYTLINSFNSNGYTLSTNGWVNGSGDSVCSWTFRKAPKFFQCLTYTGDGQSSKTISHSLNTTVGMMIVKCTNTTGDWHVFHRSGGSGNGGYLNGTDAFGSTSVFPSAPTSTNFSVAVATNAGLNKNNNTYVAYLFAHNNSDGEFGPDADQDVIKCGSFTTNSSGEIPDVNLGFEPQFVLMKASGANTSWFMMDTMRGYTLTGTQPLEANSSNAETTSWGANTYLGVPTSTGFTQGSSNTGTNNTEWIYMAIRRGPLAEPTSATDVFTAVTNGTPDSTEFRPENVDMAMFAKRGGDSENFQIADRVRGFQSTSLNSDDGYTTPTLETNNTNAEDTSGTSIHQTEGQASGGPYIRGVSSGSNFLMYRWKRAPSFFDCIAYSGSGTATQPHSLSASPEMIWIKQRDGIANWTVLTNFTSTQYDYLYLNQSSAATTVNYSANEYLSAAPTATGIPFVDYYGVNDSNPQQKYIALLFATVAGVSKVGSYTGDGTNSKTIDCGFSSGARFVMIKRTSGIGSWITYDTERGITALDDPFLYLDTNAAENTISSFDIDPHSSGFTLGGSGSYINASGQSYIFYAIA
jgi:hypothetical protein